MIVGSTIVDADDQTCLRLGVRRSRPSARLLPARPGDGARHGAAADGSGVAAGGRPDRPPGGLLGRHASEPASPASLPDAGRLVLGDWGTGSSARRTALPPTPLKGDQASARHETTIAAGRLNDWDARWDGTGTHLAVWIADPQEPGVGDLSLYAVDSFDGKIDLKKPLLDDKRAIAGYSISDGQLVWAEPAADGSTSGGRIQLARLDRRGRRRGQNRHRTGDRHPLDRAHADASRASGARRLRMRYRPRRHVRPSRMVAGAALTAALALGALPGIAGSAGPTPASAVDPATFQSVQVPAFATTDLAVEPLDAAFRAAGRDRRDDRLHRARQGAEARRRRPADASASPPPSGGSALKPPRYKLTRLRDVLRQRHDRDAPAARARR